MGIVEEVEQSSTELKTAVKMFIKTWIVMWLVMLLAGCAVVGPRAATHITAIGIPAFVAAVAWIRHRASAAAGGPRNDAYRYGEYDREHDDRYGASRGRYGGRDAYEYDRDPYDRRERHPPASSSSYDRYGQSDRRDYGRQGQSSTYGARPGAYGTRSAYDEPRKPWQSTYDEPRRTPATSSRFQTTSSRQPQGHSSSFDDQPVGGRAGAPPRSSPFARPGYNSSATSGGRSFDSPPPRRAMGYEASPVPYSRDEQPIGGYGGGQELLNPRANRLSVTAALRHSILNGQTDRRELQEVLAALEKEETAAMYEDRGMGYDARATQPAIQFLLLLEENLTTLRGVYRYAGQGSLKRVCGVGPTALTLDSVMSHTGPTGASTKLLRWQSALRTLAELPVRNGQFDGGADAFVLPSSRGGAMAGRGPGARMPLSTQSANSYGAKSGYASAYNNEDRPIGGAAARHRAAAVSERQLAEVGGRNDNVKTKANRGGCALEFQF